MYSITEHHWRRNRHLRLGWILRVENVMKRKQHLDKYIAVGELAEDIFSPHHRRSSFAVIHLSTRSKTLFPCIFTPLCFNQISELCKMIIHFMTAGCTIRSYWLRRFLHFFFVQPIKLNIEDMFYFFINFAK